MISKVLCNPNRSDPNHSMIHLSLRAEGKECFKHFWGLQCLKQQGGTDQWKRRDHEILTGVSLGRIIEEYLVLSRFRARLSGFNVIMRQGGEKAFLRSALKEMIRATVQENRHKDVPVLLSPAVPKGGPYRLGLLLSSVRNFCGIMSLLSVCIAGFLMLVCA